MFHHSWPQNQDLWTLYHKVTFDGFNKTIIINDGELNVDVKVDLYSDWKEWSLKRDHLKFSDAMRSVGGDPTVSGAFLGSTFFTTNGWRILIDDSTLFVGNLFSDDFNSPFITEKGAKIARSQFTNLVDIRLFDETDLIGAGLATTTSINNQTTTINTSIDNQTTILRQDISGVPSGVVSGLNSEYYDSVTFSDIMSIILAMAHGRIEESEAGVFKFYSQDNSTVLYTLQKTGNQRIRL